MGFGGTTLLAVGEYIAEQQVPVQHGPVLSPTHSSTQSFRRTHRELGVLLVLPLPVVVPSGTQPCSNPWCHHLIRHVHARTQVIGTGAEILREHVSRVLRGRRPGCRRPPPARAGAERAPAAGHAARASCRGSVVESGSVGTAGIVGVSGLTHTPSVFDSMALSSGRLPPVPVASLRTWRATAKGLSLRGTRHSPRMVSGWREVPRVINPQTRQPSRIEPSARRGREAAGSWWQ